MFGNTSLKCLNQIGISETKYGLDMVRGKYDMRLLDICISVDKYEFIL